MKFNPGVPHLCNHRIEVIRPAALEQQVTAAYGGNSHKGAGFNPVRGYRIPLDRR